MFVTISSVAQNNIVLQGKLFKKNSNKPIPFVHISLSGSSIGTISNISGEFQLNIAKKHEGGFLHFSCIGYEPMSLQVSRLKKEETIYLIPSQTMLTEVIITPKSASDIVRDAIKNIPKNYPSIPMKSFGFYREEVENAKGEHLYLSEGLLQVHKESYRSKHQRGHVKMIKGRSKTFQLLDSLNTRFYAGAHIAHRFDFVMKRKDFLSIERMNDFFYKHVGETTSNGNPVYIIMFWPKNKFTGNYKGKMFIDAETGAFLSFECKATQHYINNMNILQKAHWKERKYIVQYRLINGKWHLNNVWQKGIYENKLLEIIAYTTEFAVTKFDTTMANPIKYADRLHYQDIFLLKVDTLQAEFWESNNIIKESYNTTRLNNARNTSNKAFHNWLFKNGNKISLNYSLSALPIKTDAKNISFTCRHPSVNFKKNIELKDRVETLIYYSIHYQTKKNLNIGWGMSADIFGKYKWSENTISLSYQYSLLKENKRPIYIQPTLGISYYIMSIPLGKFENADSGLKIGNKNFDSSEIQIDLSTKNLGIKSAISLLYEINPKISLSLETGLYTKIKNSDVVKFKEKKGFFLTRKSTSLRFTDQSLSIQSNNVDISKLPLNPTTYISIGVIKKL